MGTDIDARLADLRGELGRQNEVWERTKRAIAQLGDEPLAVPREFLRQLGALAPERDRAGAGIRV